MTTPCPAAAQRPALLAALGFGAALALAACSGKTVKPGNSLAEAETAVARAERARIGDYDPASWKAARDNLAQARANANASSGSKEQERAGRWYAARAKADADLGLVRAERARLGALTAALKREIGTLAPAAAPAPAPSTPATATEVQP